MVCMGIVEQRVLPRGRLTALSRVPNGPILKFIGVEAPAIDWP